jgi:Tfp pilus assembly protein PilP
VNRLGRKWSPRRLAFLTTLALGGAALTAAGVRAQAPAAGAPAVADPTMKAPPAPGLGAVKDTVKDAMKDVMAGAPKLGTAEAQPTPAVVGTDPASRATVLRRKTLREQDFVDSDETNRDPFKSFMRFFTEKATAHGRQVPAVFDKFTLEELSLIAIVSGDAQPRAMFRDPAGLGQTVKRGDYLSKAGARVTKILSDRVIVELSEAMPTGDARPTEKAILVNPEEEAGK